MNTAFCGSSFKVTYTHEPQGAHFTCPDNYCENSYAVTVMLKGSGSCFIEGEGFILDAGDMVLIGKDQLRCFRIDGEEEHERMSFYLTEEAFLPVLGHGLLLSDIFRSGSIQGAANSGETADIIADIRAMMLNIPQQTAGMWEAKLHLYLLQLVLCLQMGQQNKNHGDKNGDSGVVFQICSYVRRNLEHSISYSDIERDLRISRYQLTDVFPKCMGMTLTEFIIQKRLGRVSELVHEGWSLENAAQKAGFGNYSHFYKAFKKHRGVSPREFFAIK